MPPNGMAFRLTVAVLVAGTSPFCSPHSNAPVTAEAPDAMEGQRRFSELCSGRTDVALDPAATTSQVRSADFDLEKGFLVVDGIEKQLFQFSPVGRLTRTLGHPGRRPGELREPLDGLLLSADRVLALDGSTGLQLFDQHGKASTVLARSALQRARGLATLSIDHVLVATTGSAQSRASHATAVSVGRREVVRVIRGDEVATADAARVLYRAALIAANPSGTVVALGRPHELRIQLVSPSGTSLRVITPRIGGFQQTRPMRRRPRSRADLERWAYESSHLIALGWLTDSRLLIEWDSFRAGRRHYFVFRFLRIPLSRSSLRRSHTDCSESAEKRLSSSTASPNQTSR